MPRLNHLASVLEVEAVFDLRRIYNRAATNQKLRPGDVRRLCQIIEAYDARYTEIAPSDEMVQASLREMRTLLERFEPYATVWCYIEKLEHQRDQAEKRAIDANISAARAEMEAERYRTQTPPGEYTIDPSDVRIRYNSSRSRMARTEVLTRRGWRPVSNVMVEHMDEESGNNGYPGIVQAASLHPVERVARWNGNALAWDVTEKSDAKE